MLGYCKMEKFSTLAAFVHVPKTAGSMINAQLHRSGMIGQDHIEAWRGKQELAKARLRKLDWVSGHVNFPEMRAMLSAATPRPLQFYTALRDPVQQIASHYNWLIEIHHRGQQFYESHPPNIRGISERIRATDHSKPEAIIAQLDAAPGLFLNQQCRTILGENLGDMSAEMLRSRLAVFHYVATEKTLPELLNRLIGNNVSDLTRENTSSYHFDAGVFRSPELVAFLEERHAADMALYGFIASRSSELFPKPKQSERDLTDSALRHEKAVVRASLSSLAEKILRSLKLS